MILRFINSEIGKKLVNEKEKNNFIYSLTNDFKKYNFKYNNKNKDDYEIDVILSKQILLHFTGISKVRLQV